MQWWRELYWVQSEDELAEFERERRALGAQLAVSELHVTICLRLSVVLGLGSLALAYLARKLAHPRPAPQHVPRQRRGGRLAIRDGNQDP